LPRATDRAFEPLRRSISKHFLLIGDFRFDDVDHVCRILTAGSEGYTVLG
jgi:hypothetical protein